LLSLQDYTQGIKELGPYADYLVINVSSPNTPGLRSLQQADRLHNLITSTQSARDQYAPHAPLFVKLAPDLTNEEMTEIAQVMMQTQIDGMIVSNTTNARPDFLLSKNKTEIGGLSGAPIKERSTECIRIMYQLTKGDIPIIGVGGVGSGRDAYEKMKAGASMIQVYSMMVYEGPGLISRIRKELAEIVEENGHKSVEEVVGLDCEEIYWTKREEMVKRKMSEVGAAGQTFVEL
jgi:dihydroorotate dehydrogenase